MKTRVSSDDKVICYMYQRCYVDRLIYQTDECFIPSEKICFGRNEAYKSEIPNNKDDGFFKSHTILKKVLLPTGWIEKLIEKLDKDTVKLDKVETEKIFGESLFMDFFASEKDFEQNYKQFGTFILPNYIMRYFNEKENMNADSKTANRILNIISSLDDIEKKSLTICLDERKKYLIEKRKFYGQDKKIESPIALYTGTVATAVGVATGLMFESIPAGIFAGGLVLFGKKKHDDFRRNQCKEYCNKILGLLNLNHRQYFPS